MEMETKSRLEFLLCPRCGGKTRTQVKKNTVLKEFLSALLSKM